MSERLLTLGAAADFIKGLTGRTVSACSIWRWCRRGIRGVRLPYCRVGRSIHVTENDLTEFFRRLAQVDKVLGDRPDHVSRPHAGGALGRAVEHENASAGKALVKLGVLDEGATGSMRGGQ